MKKSLFRVILVTALILLIPLVGMQLSSDVNWTVSDFVVAGALLLATGVCYELIMRKLDKKYRLPAVVALATAFLWLYVELAVGLFTNWGS